MSAWVVVSTGLGDHDTCVPTVVLLVPTSTYRATDFVAAARALDLTLVVASDEAPPLTDPSGTRALAVPLDDPEVASERLVALDDRRGIDAVVALDDRGVLVAARAAERLGLAHNPPDAVARTRDKAAMRHALEQSEVPQPAFAVVDDPEQAGVAALGIGFPVVVKPLGLSASQGVIRADDPLGAVAAARRAAAIAGVPNLLVEAFVPGDEIAVEGLRRGGRTEVLAVFDKPDTSDGPYFEETIYVTPSRLPQPTLDTVIKVVDDACGAIGLTEGPIHAELRVEGDRVSVIEVAARSIGGLCARALRFGAGISLEEVILRHAVGMSLDGLAREDAASGVMMLPIERRGTLVAVEGREQALAVAGIVGLEITIPPGRPVMPPPDGDRYLGFLFARAETPAAVEHALRTAHAWLRVVLAP
jgi:biotin carboxylase